MAAVYLAVSVFIWWHVWSGHPTSTLTCACGDPTLFVSSFGWVAHALAHGHNPFLSTAVFHPGGINLLANTSALLEAFLLTPVTWIFGPVAALDVANTLAPAASALAVYWAVRRCLRVGRPAALVAGLIVELAPAMVGSLAVSHLQLSMIAFVPVMAVCFYELLVRQQGPAWRWGAVLAAAAVGQFFAGTELLVIAALVGALVLTAAGGAFAVGVARGSATAAGRAGHAGRGLAVAALGASAALAVPAWFALAGPRHIVGQPWPGLMQFTGTAAHGIVFRQRAADAEPLVHLAGYLGPVGQAGGYLGLGAVLVAVAAVVTLWRRPAVGVLAAVAVVATWLSLGSQWLPAGAHRPPWVPFLPWSVFSRLPLVRNVLAENFIVITLLAVAALVALIVDRAAQAGRGWGRAATAGLAAALSVAALGPLVTTWPLPLTVTSVDTPAWFVRDAPQLPADSVVLAYPFAGLPGEGEATVWQALGGMHVTLAGGFGLVPGPTGTVDHGTTAGSATAVLGALSQPSAGAMPRLDDVAARDAVRTAMSRWGVTVVVVTDRGRDPAYATTWFTALLGRPPAVVDGARVWTIAG